MTSKKIKKEEAKETLLKCTLDSLATLSQANQETLGRRREQIKPGLNEQFKQLCGNVPPESALLFGDHINKQISDIVASTNRTVDKFKPSKSTHYRYVHENNSKNFENFAAKGPNAGKSNCRRGNNYNNQGSNSHN